MKYFLYDIFNFLVFPVILVVDTIRRLFAGELFPIVFEFGEQCGVAGGYEAVGNGKHWLVIVVLILVILIKVITRKPRTLVLILVLHFAMIGIQGISELVGGAGPRICY